MIDVEQTNLIINDTYLTNLIRNTTELSSIIKSDLNSTKNLIPRDDEKLVESLENILNLNHKLNNLCDDSDKFDEAVKLLDFIDTLNKKYGHEISLIENIYQTSRRQRARLVANLCDKLEHLKVDDSSVSYDINESNEAISIVNNLIKCGNFSDRDLRLKYLQSRDNWFNNACEDKSSSFDDVVSVYCEGLPMIFQEYKTIFNNSDKEILNWKPVKAKLASLNDKKEDGAIINSWLLLKTSIFIESLEVYLKSSNQSEMQTPSMIGDTMSKCFELTSWLSTIGFDFSSQLKPLFYRAITREVKLSIDNATVKFESAFTTVAMKSIESLLLPVDDDILRISHLKSDKQLPKSIEHYPIFKIYCLNIIDSLRWLQTTKNIISPIPLCPDTYQALNASFTRISKTLAIILNVDNNSTHPILAKITISFVTEFVPYMSNYCEQLFPERMILSTIGLTKSEFKTLCSSESDKVENFHLDIKGIANPLKSTMPSLLLTMEN